MSQFRNHGIIRKKLLKKKNELRGYYEQYSLGYNYRITDLQSVLGISQMKKINQFVKRRNKIAKFYIKSLRDLNIKFQKFLKSKIKLSLVYNKS